MKLSVLCLLFATLIFLKILIIKNPRFPKNRVQSPSFNNSHHFHLFHLSFSCPHLDFFTFCYSNLNQILDFIFPPNALVCISKVRLSYIIKMPLLNLTKLTIILEYYLMANSYSSAPFV